jgi:hypothetical protein
VLASLRRDLRQLQLLGHDLRLGLALAGAGAADAQEPGDRPDFAALHAGALASEASALVDSLAASIGALLEQQLLVRRAAGAPAPRHLLPLQGLVQRAQAPGRC